jgi:hypothetical protein
MSLKTRTVNSILNNRNDEIWEKITDEFISKIKQKQKLDDDKVEKLKKELMDKTTFKKAVEEFIVMNKKLNKKIGGGKKKSRRRKKKKRAKKTKRRYQRGGELSVFESSVFIYMGIMGTSVICLTVWRALEWGCGQAYNLANSVYSNGDNEGEPSPVATEPPPVATATTTEEEKERREWQEEHSEGGEGVTKESATRASDHTRR